MRPICPAVTREISPAPTHNSNGDWTSLRQIKRHPEFPVITRESRQNLEVSPSSRDEALSPCSVSREIPRSLVNSKRYLKSLMQQKNSPTHRSHLRGTLSFPVQLNLSPFCPLISIRGSTRLLCLQRDPDLTVAPQKEAGLILQFERKPRGSCHFKKDNDLPVCSR